MLKKCVFVRRDSVNAGFPKKKAIKDLKNRYSELRIFSIPDGYARYPRGDVHEQHLPVLCLQHYCQVHL